MKYFGFTLLLFAALILTTFTAIAQHRYYVRTLRRLVREHNHAGYALVSGSAKGRFRGAVAVLVLRTEDETIAAAAVMEGSSVLARFKDRPDWVGLSASGSLPRCSPRVARAVAEARKRVPGNGTTFTPTVFDAGRRRGIGWSR
jgi:DNA-binding transcriptional regulator of glucitol operon